MSSLSEEEENYVRLALLLTGLSPKAVRALFDKEFPRLPSTLNLKYNTVLSLKKSRVITQEQWNLMYPTRSGVADSKTFDVTLMICLIRNLTSITPPVLGFDRLPSTLETTPGADLARIKYYRNLLAYLDDNKIDNSYFTTALNDISNAVRRLGDLSMYQECEDLKTKILDQSNKEIMLEIKNSQKEINNVTHEVTKLKRSCNVNAQQTEKLKISHEQMVEEIKELKTGIQESTKEIEMLKDTVPWNIREQMTTKLENWKKDDRLFVHTRGASHVLQCIKTNRCVTVTASSGVGKTFTIRHVALQMAEDGYDILPVTNPEDIVNFNNPNKKTLYVIDDLCGKYTLNKTYLDKWKTMHEDIKGVLVNDGTKIIASCRLQVYQDKQFKLLPLFTACECSLVLPNMSLTQKENELIAEKYIKSDASKISEYIYFFDFFPLLCKLYNEHQSLNAVDFLKHEFSVFEKEIDMLNTEKAYGKYCALFLCVIFNNHLKEEWLTDVANQDIREIIENVCEACKLNKTTPRLVLQDELDSLIHTFLKKEQGCYRTIHDKHFKFLSFYFGKTPMIQCIIRNGDQRLISERLIFNKKDSNNPFITIVPDKYQKLYIKRLLDDWSKGEVVKVFTNINMKSPEFRNIFLMYLKTLTRTDQEKLAIKCDNAAYTPHVSLQTLFERDDYKAMTAYHGRMNSPLLHCCALGDINMVEWCCSNGADVNYCSNGEESPLYIACKGGYTDIVTKLVGSKADINKSSFTVLRSGQSPLYVACKGGFTDIVTTLLENDADINTCTEWGMSPLHAACMRGYTGIVTKLIENKADINKCTRYGESPLYIACEGGYTDIVTKLVENKAKINKCADKVARNGQSPLYVACLGGYTDIVNKLVDNKADINKCTYGVLSGEESPLYVACKGGYTDIVNKLVDNKANINNGIPGESPLNVACKLGYKDIVTKLVDNKADINKLDYNRESPLYVACKEGYTDIVTKLVDNKANINKCARKRESSLYVACKEGYTDIVNKLVDKKADINKCALDGESPLYIACKGGYTAIVTTLVDNKADINICTEYGKESPLHIACKGGYTDIVTKLVDNMTDVNKCIDYNGESPLYIACKGGYTDIVSKLVENNADVNKCLDYNGESPLYIACKGGYTDIVTKLMDNKADINKCKNDGESPLDIACKGGYAKIVTKLLDNNADINKCTVADESPLCAALRMRIYIRSCKAGEKQAIYK